MYPDLMSGRHVGDEEQSSKILLNLTHPREMGIFMNLIFMKLARTSVGMYIIQIKITNISLCREMLQMISICANVTKFLLDVKISSNIPWPIFM